MKTVFKKISSVVILLLVIHSCTIFKRSIPKHVVVALPDTLFLPAISSTALNAKYTNNITPGEVMASFFKGFKMEGKNTPNITLQYNTDHADFILKFKYLSVIETSTIQTITDPKSLYNGQGIVLNTVNVSAEFELTETKDPGTKPRNCSNSKQRAESETNNRDISDLISGTNKDRSQYRTKLLNDNIAITLAEDVGRRIWVPLSRKIDKDLK